MSIGLQIGLSFLAGGLFVLGAIYLLDRRIRRKYGLMTEEQVQEALTSYEAKATANRGTL
jgi:hypothetical protein